LARFQNGTYTESDLDTFILFLFPDGQEKKLLKGDEVDAFITKNLH